MPVVATASKSKKHNSPKRAASLTSQQQQQQQLGGGGDELRTRKKSAVGFIGEFMPRFNVGGRARRRGSAESSGKKLSLDAVSVPVLNRWAESLGSLLQDQDGVFFFEEFLKSEFSEENILFWKACERYKTVAESSIKEEATTIYEEYISQSAAKLVNIDHHHSREIVDAMQAPSRDTFSKAQHSIFLLMARDSYVRFIKSDKFQSALQR